MSDPWAKRLKWGVVIGLVVVWLVSMRMAWNGGKASGIVESYEERDSLMIQAWREEAPRIDAARAAYARCLEIQTPETCL